MSLAAVAGQRSNATAGGSQTTPIGPQTTPTGPQTTPQHALEALRRAIVAGELRPGQRIAQEQFAERVGVSIAPVREALRMLEQEGQVVYRPRRGYFVRELRIGDLEEIYELRRLLEERAARAALPRIDAFALASIRRAADDCARAASRGEVAAQLEANRRFHFAILDGGAQPHTMRLIHMLWEATEPYRAMYYNSAGERRRSNAAHQRIVRSLKARDADGLVAELDAHRARALEVLRRILPA
jgi:DNA-binding GntR family transcriptional regulator